VQDPERARFSAADGITSPSWLTLVGAAPAADVRARCEGTPLSCIAGRYATVVRAADAPNLCDQHLMDPAREYIAAARALAPWTAPSAPRFYGAFWTADGSARWAKRFVDPGGWAQ
jgi:hypothetical protein